MEIRALREDDDRSRFSCGDHSLDDFLRRFAGQNQFKHYIGMTYVAAESGKIIAYVTVSPAHIEIDDLPAAARKKLPHYPLPILRLARLAVDTSFQGQGLGVALLRFVLQLSVRMAGEVGCTGVMVDAKPAAERFYAKYGLVTVDAVEGQADTRPQTREMFLAMRQIKQSLR